MLTVYPLYMALLVATTVVMIAWRGLTLRRAGTSLKPLLKPLLLSAAAVVAMALLFDPVAVARDIHYYHLVAENLVPYPRVSYKLPISEMPGWIGQTREFWALSGLRAGGAKQIFLGVDPAACLHRLRDRRPEALPQRVRPGRAWVLSARWSPSTATPVSSRAPIAPSGCCCR